MARTDDLVALLNEARVAYYNGTPVMTDAAFDTLEDELRALDPTNGYFKAVGAAPGSDGWPKFTHLVPMGSLNKAQDEGEMRSWVISCTPTGKILITEKLDGISISLYYGKGILKRAVTRGDGIEGEDITRNVLLMKGVPHRVPGFTGHVRGEIVCLHSDFEAHFKAEGYSNCRNTASGVAKRQSDPTPCQHLTVICYEWLPDDGGLDSKWDEFEALKAAGFLVPRYALTDKGPGALQFVYRKYVDSLRDALDYDIDGLVLYVDDNGTRENLGDLNGRPKGAVAYKFPHEEKKTILRAIRWQVGKSGRITPVAEFDTVSLAGANVKQASLHNVANMRALLLKGKAYRDSFAVGDEILVSRRNDVIPYVEALLTPATGIVGGASATDPTSTAFVDLFGATDPSALATGLVLLPVPEVCPECEADLSMQGEYLVCTNGAGCGAQTVGAVVRWLSKVNILDWGTSSVEALCAKGLVKDPSDLYYLDVQTLASVHLGGRVIGGSAQGMIDNLRAKMELPLDLIVGSLGIPLWGRSMCQILVAQGFDTLGKMTEAKVADIARLPNVGQTKAEAFVQGFKDVYPTLFNLIQAGITVQAPASGVMLGKTVCYTDVRESDQEVAFAAQGGTVKGSVSKTLTYLVAGSLTATTGKANKAREYQAQGHPIQIVTVDDMWALLGGKPV